MFFFQNIADEPTHQMILAVAKEKDLAVVRFFRDSPFRTCFLQEAEVVADVDVDVEDVCNTF